MYSWLMLIRLFQLATICSVAVCRDRRFRKICAIFSINLRPRTPVRSTWPPVGGRTGSGVLGVDTRVRIR